MEDNNLRIDKWLWAARFYKTRSQATAAVDGGQVLLNRQRCKPAHPLAPADLLQIDAGGDVREIVVLALSAQRGSATLAQQLYRETEASLQRRQSAAEQRRLAPEPTAQLKGRPTKRDRRRLQQWRD
jgi:ribosome-associated heat shock protein Hsp15